MYHSLLPCYTTFSNLDKGQRKLLASFSPTLFNWSGWNLVWWWNSSSWAPWFYTLGKVMESREISAFLLTVLNKFNVYMHSDILELIWFKLDLMIDVIELYILPFSDPKMLVHVTVVCWAGGREASGQVQFGTAALQQSHLAQIGISVEPLDQLSQQTPVTSSSDTSVTPFMEFSTKMLESFFNYASSFAVQQVEMVPNPSETFVPLSTLQKWFENFQRRLQQNANFWKSWEWCVRGFVWCYCCFGC